MTASEFISFLYRKGATEESPMCGAPPIFAKGALSNWRLFLTSDGYENVGSLTRFVTINNLEDYEVRVGVSNKLYRSNVDFEFSDENNYPTVRIIRYR